MDLQLTNGCIRFFPMGYRYGLGSLIETAVNHKMNPERRSSKESRVEAMIANDPLLIDAYTFAANNNMLQILEI